MIGNSHISLHQLCPRIFCCNKSDFASTKADYYRRDVISSILDYLRSSSQPNATPSHLPRSLLILLQVIKELATARLQRMRAALKSVAPEIMQVLGRIYIDKVQIWRTFIAAGGDDEGGALESIEQSLLAIKVMRRLLIAGFEFPNREKDVQAFWTIIRGQFGDFLYLVTEGSEALSPQAHQLAQKHLLQLSKIHLEMARSHPAAFALLPDSVGLIRAYWGLITIFGETYGTNSAVPQVQSANDAEDEDKPVMEKLCLKGLLLVRACIKMVFSPSQTFKYRLAEEKEEQKQATHMMKTELLTDDLVKEIMGTIVSRFFVFRSADLMEWEKEPEEWEIREDGEGDGWEFSVRPCSEKVFLDLTINFKDLLVQPMLDVFATVSCKSQYSCARGFIILIANSTKSGQHTVQGLRLYGNWSRFVRNTSAARL